MNDQLQKALAQFLQLMLDGVQKGAGFAQEQLPLVIQEKLHYELYSSLVWIGIWIVILLLAWVTQQIVWRAVLAAVARSTRSYTTDGQDFARFGTLVLAIVLSVAGVIDIIYNIDHAIYIWIAPRVYILDWLKELIK